MASETPRTPSSDLLRLMRSLSNNKRKNQGKLPSGFNVDKLNALDPEIASFGLFLMDERPQSYEYRNYYFLARGVEASFGDEGPAMKRAQEIIAGILAANPRRRAPAGSDR